MGVLMKTVISAACSLLALMGLSTLTLAQTSPGIQNPLRPASPPVAAQPAPGENKADDKSKSSSKPKAERSEAQKANDNRMRACGKEWRENKDKLKAAGKTWKTFGPDCRAKLKAEGK
jgi:hypothetical protein